MSITFFSTTDIDGYDVLADLNVSNANAWRLLGALGIEQDYVGSISGEDLKGRILLVQAVGATDRLDVADPASRSLMAALSAGGAEVVDCSRPLDEYLAVRLPLLLEVAESAIRSGSLVFWS